MKLCTVLLSSVCACVLSAPIVKAEIVSSFTTSLTPSSLTEAGRPYRSGTPQDWTGTETYSGVTSVANTYFYNTYNFAASSFNGAPYVEVTDFEPNNTANYFLAAYAGSYNPADRAANWLGDAGFSGNAITGDGGDFQVIVPTGDNLVLVLNSVGLGLGTPIQIVLNAYSDTNYDPPVPTSSNVTPEPSSVVLLGTGLAGVLAATRRRFRLPA